MSSSPTPKCLPAFTNPRRVRATERTADQLTVLNLLNDALGDQILHLIP